jgi:hypothetical protein
LNREDCQDIDLNEVKMDGAGEKTAAQVTALEFSMNLDARCMSQQP